MRKYAIEGISGMEMSGLNKGFEHKTEQRKLKMVSSNVVYLQPCQLWEDSPKHAFSLLGLQGVGVCVCTRTCALGERVVQLHFRKHVRFLLLNDYSGELLLT